MSTTRFLTGITTTGTPHLGNFVGSIRPSVAASLRPGVQSFYSGSYTPLTLPPILRV